MQKMANSGTGKPKKSRQSHRIIWLTGQSGAGKSTLARLLQKKIGGVVLDGDEMRQVISRDLGFSKKDRHEHNIRVSRLALALSKQTTVIISVIAPFAKTRKHVTTLINPVWIYVRRVGIKNGRDYPYEAPRKPHISLNTDRVSPSESVQRIADFLSKRKI